MPEAQDIQGIIFDFGGTLDTGGDHWSRVIHDYYLKNGVDIAFDHFRKAYVTAERAMAGRVSSTDTFREMMMLKIRLQADALGIGADKAAAIAADCYDHARRHTDKVKGTLELLSGSIPLAVVSNFYGNLEAVLSDFELKPYFRVCVDSACVGVRKPDPAIFRIGCDLLGVDPRHVLVVGDSDTNDIRPAASIGCMTLRLKGRTWE